jgi:hypothetical protein
MSDYFFSLETILRRAGPHPNYLKRLADENNQ